MRRTTPDHSLLYPHCSSKQPATPEQAELPFELQCLEAALETALSVMAAETAALEMHTAPLFNRVSRKARPALGCFFCSRQLDRCPVGIGLPLKPRIASYDAVQICFRWRGRSWNCCVIAALGSAS